METIPGGGAASPVQADGLDDMYLLFHMESQVYGIEIRYVLQIIEMQKIIEMPDMEPGMKGYIDLRGSIIPVASMRLHMGKPEAEYTDRTCIIVTQIGEKEIGLIVDAIQETTTIEAGRVSPAPSMTDGTAAGYAKGVARLEGGGTAMLFHAPALFAS